MTQELSNQLDFEAQLSFGPRGDVAAYYEHVSLSSVFRPIVDRTRSVVGFEALSRVCDDEGNAVSSADLFAHCADGNRGGACPVPDAATQIDAAAGDTDGDGATTLADALRLAQRE